MIKCPVCNNEIKLQNLNKHYKITLGDIEKSFISTITE